MTPGNRPQTSSKSGPGGTSSDGAYEDEFEGVNSAVSYPEYSPLPGHFLAVGTRLEARDSTILFPGREPTFSHGFG